MVIMKAWLHDFKHCLRWPVEVVFSRLRLPDLRCRTTLLTKAFGGYGLRLSVIPLPFCFVLVT